MIVFLNSYEHSKKPEKTYYETDYLDYSNSLTHSMMLHLQRKEPFKADEAASVTPKIRY